MQNKALLHLKEKTTYAAANFYTHTLPRRLE
jgi:hypothetical protein